MDFYSFSSLLKNEFIERSPMIEIKNLSYQIKNTEILKNINLTIPKNGITAIIGPNGAGKSTLINLIAQQLTIQTGKIILDDIDVKTAKSAELALKIALVAQHVGVSSRISVKDLIGFGRWPHNQGQMCDKDYGAVEEALELFALIDLQDRFLDELSGGQRQRAFVAMAFAQATDWLLLDEPLNNLDMYHARELMIELQKLARERGKSIIMIVHEVNYAAAWADHVIGLKSGEVLLNGSPTETLNQDGIKSLYGMDVEIKEINGKPLIMHIYP